MTQQREALWDEDFDYLFDDRWWDVDTGAEPTAGPAQDFVPDRSENPYDDDVRADDHTVSAGRISTQLPSIESWTTPSTRRRHRPRWSASQTRAVIIALVVTAVVGAATLLVWRLSTGNTDDDQPTSNVTPTSNQPTLSVAPTTTPTASRAPAPPPPLPPPPPPPPDPAASAAIPRQPQNSRPRYNTPPQNDDGPRINVTRAPMSVAPKPVTPPKTATPGENGGRRGGFRRVLLTRCVTVWSPQVSRL